MDVEPRRGMVKLRNMGLGIPVGNSPTGTDQARVFTQTRLILYRDIVMDGRPQ